MNIMETCANDIVKELQEKREMIATWASKVRSMVSEIKNLRNRVASQETSLAKEPAARQAAEEKARSLQKELVELQRIVEDKKQTIKASSPIIRKLEKQRRAARAQTRNVKRMAKKREKTIKDLREEVRAIKISPAASASRNQSFWESSCFKIVASVSMVALAIFCKR